MKARNASNRELNKEILNKIGTAFNSYKTGNINKEGIGLGLFICNILIIPKFRSLKRSISSRRR